MRFLLDTNVISEVRHPRGHREMKRRFSALDPESLYTSSVVFGELIKGIAQLSEGRRKRSLAAWISRFETEFGDRILPFDRETAQIWGQTIAECQSKGLRVGVSDGQIAATAIQHGLALITRNVRHFEPTGVRIWNIWENDSQN